MFLWGIKKYYGLKFVKYKNNFKKLLTSYIIYAIGLLSWIIYGAYLNSMQMMIFNTPAFIFALIIIVEMIYNRYCAKENK